MSAPSGPAGEFQTSPERRRTTARATRYSMLVLASNEADAVAAVGGLLFDRASAGWIVDVRLPLPTADIPFRILGVPVGVLADRMQADQDRPDALVVSARLHSRDAAVRSLVADAARHPGTDVAMWGGTWPRELGPSAVRVQHRLSHAAVAFKSHALAAAGLPPDSGAAEEFHSDRAGFALVGSAAP